VAGEPEEVVGLVGRQAERAGESAQHLDRRLGTAGLLEPGVVVDRHAGEVCDLLAAQAGRPPAWADGQSDVCWLQCLAAAAEEVGERAAIHTSIIARTGNAKQGSRVRG
jgi:hypothetical protein